jgi:hypothetical protein
MRRFAIYVIFAVTLALTGVSTAAEPKTKNIIFVMMDGLRWQEVFQGADESLISRERGGVTNVQQIKERFWREDPAASRAEILPFFWNTIAKQGQIFGNGPQNSIAKVTNDKVFSYPGYSEVLCGYPDEWVSSNAKIPNRNVTVLEWLHQKPEFKNQIAAFTSWDVFPFIINAPRSGIPVNSGFMPLTGVEPSAEIAVINDLNLELPLYGEETRPDALTFQAALTYLKAKHPRVLFVSFDETDTQGHAGRYDRVLSSARKNDDFIRRLWETAQSIPQYKDSTTLIITTDHGRGDPPVEWKSHNNKIAGAEYIWAAFLGPDTPALGERRDVEPITQNQIAATLAAYLGFDYPAEQPKAGPPIRSAVSSLSPTGEEVSPSGGR